MTKETQQAKRIEAYAIADFVKQIQEAVLEGYRLNLEDNDKYPVQIGMGYYATLEFDNPVLESIPCDKEGKETFVATDKPIFVRGVSKADVDAIMKMDKGAVFIESSDDIKLVSKTEREAIIQDAVKATESVVQPSKPGRKPKG